MAIKINDEIIENETIENEFHQVKGEHERRLQVACCERNDEFLGMAKDNLISRVLLHQEAKRRFPEIPQEEVEQRLQRLQEEAGGEEAFFQQMGPMIPSPEELMLMVANGARIDKTMQLAYGEEREPTLEECREFYEVNAHLYHTEHRVRVTHLSITPSATRSKWEVYEFIRSLRLQIVDGAEIASLAAAHNSNQDFPPDLGWFRRGEFMEEFETQAFSMSEGEVSPVFITQLGYHVFKVTGVELPQLKPLEEVLEEVTVRWREHQRDLKFHEFLEGLKAKAIIEDDLGDNF